MQWCPTELDNEGKYVSGKWGYCMDYDADWLPDACDPVVQSGKNGTYTSRTSRSEEYTFLQ